VKFSALAFVMAVATHGACKPNLEKGKAQGNVDREIHERPNVQSDASALTESKIGNPDSAKGDSFLAKFESLLSHDGRRFARSPEDDAVTTFVVDQLRKAGKALPPDHRFVISGNEDHLIVSVLDVAVLRAGFKKNLSVTYHITAIGGLRVLYLEAGI
jgi:hypothetical protein